MSRKGIPVNVLNALAAQPWLITEAALQQILEIAQRDNPDPEAIAKELGRELANTFSVTVRDGVATLPVNGPLFRYANMFTRISGATSLEELSTEFGTALASHEVKAIIFDIDSPGGQVNGVSEFAAMIAAARGEKPIKAVVTGTGASGALWIASAADEIIAIDTAILGSIGVALTVRGGAAKGEMIEIVSSQSPRKRIDAEKPEGKAQLQVIVDDLAAVFVERVATYLGVSVDKVLSDFGQGGVMVAAAAVEAGLANRIATLEEVHAELAAAGPQSIRFSRPAVRGLYSRTAAISTESSMPEPTKDTKEAAAAEPSTAEQLAAKYPTLVAELREESRQAGIAEGKTVGQVEGATAERDRVLKIQGLAAAGQQELIASCVNDPKCTPEAAALKIVEADRAARAGQLSVLKTDEKDLNKPTPNASVDAEGPQAEAQRILTLHQGNRPKRASA